MKKTALALAASLLVSWNVSAKVKFSQSELEADFSITHPVITANLYGGENDQIILLGENSEQQRVLAIYSLEIDCSAAQPEKYVQVAQLVIPDNFLAFDILKTSKREKLVFQSNRAIFELDTTVQTFNKMVDSHSIYLRENAQFLSGREFVKDVNDDKLDDLVVPGFDSLQLFFQKEDGSFSLQKLPIAPKIDIDNDSATYAETPLYFADINLDEKTDLITIEDAALKVFKQNGEGGFETAPTTYSVPIDFKALNWWEIREADGDSLDQNNLAYRTVSQIEDINNDQVADLMVRFSQTAGVLDRQNNYEIYLGRKSESGVSYPSTPDSVLSVDGTTISVKTIDLNGDNKSEVVLSSLDIGVGQIIGALLSGSIDQDIYVFKMNGDDKFDEDPKTNREVDLTFSLSSGKSGQPVIQVADFDGDGLKDLMISGGEKTLKFYQGNSKKSMLERRSKRHKVLLPKDGEMVETKDLNKDGKNDVIIRYGRQDEKALHNKLVILFAS